MLGIPARRIWFGQSAGEKPFPFRPQLDQKKKEPRRRDAGGGDRPRSVARIPEDDVGGAVVGRGLALDQAAAEPVGAEFGSADLEVDVGLAARLRDLAPAGADLVALTGVDPVIGRLVAGPVDRDDGERRGDVEGLEGAGIDAVVELGERAERDSHNASPWVVSRGPSPAMSRARRPHRAPPSPRASARAAEATRRTWEAGKFAAQRPRGGGLALRGNFSGPPGWGRRPRAPALERHAGTGLRKNPNEVTDWLMHGSSCTRASIGAASGASNFTRGSGEFISAGSEATDSRIFDRCG